MPKKLSGGADPLVEKLDAIHSALQDLLIFEGARVGMTMAQVRKMLGVDNNRVSRIWQYVKPPKSD